MQRMAYYSTDWGTSYIYRPWIVIMSDGDCDAAENRLLDGISAKISSAVARKELNIMCINMGDVKNAVRIADYLVESGSIPAKKLLAGWCIDNKNKYTPITDLVSEKVGILLIDTGDYGKKLLEEVYDSGDRSVGTELAGIMIKSRDREDLDKAVEILRAEIKNGNDEAVRIYAGYLKENGTFENELSLFSEAGAEGSVNSWIEIADFYRDKKDDAFYYAASCKAAAKLGDIYSGGEFGRCLLDGYGVPKDKEAAEEHLKRAVQGKPYYVYMTAGANKFLRIYYGRVNEYLSTLSDGK